jgi:hypothetical protein
MLSADTITERYLAEFDRPIFPLPESHSAKIRFAGRYLSRPLFFEAQVLSALERDLSLMWSALTSLPQRVYDGDLQRFARAVGMPEPQAECVVRSVGPVPRALSRMTRADLYKDAIGFRLLEWNIGSTLGGMESVDLCRSLLAIPELAVFLGREQLAYADTYDALAATIRSETGFPPGSEPVVALVEAPNAFSSAKEMMRDKAARLAGYGLRTMIGHLGELFRSNGRLRLRGEPVDVVYRTFTLEEVLVHIDDGVLEPLLSAAELGEAVIFTALDGELYGSKGSIALLSEPSGQIGLTSDERDACARVLPWTRLLRAGETALEDGTGVDMPSYALQHQHDLVLKPSMSYGGNGVLVGSDPDVTPQMWRAGVTRAAEGFPCVVQRLVKAEPELFPSGTPGSLDAWTINWGAFTMGQGYAGMHTRGLPASARTTVINNPRGGSFMGCAFHGLV